ncbi:MAG: hypothetical protein ACOZB3_12685 [Calditrichota bacterium]
MNREMKPAADNVFATCSSCGMQWENLSDFLNDRQVVLNGYQVTLPNPDDGLFLWTHRNATCRTTFSVGVAKFKQLYLADIPRESLHGTEVCMRLCDDSSNLSPCSQACRLRWVRDVIQLLRARKMPAAMEI